MMRGVLRLRMWRQAAGWVALLSCAAVVAHASPGSGRTASHAKPQGYLGIEFHDVGEDAPPALERLRTQRGSVEVLMVDHDGPAGRAGLEPHDLIVQMDGKVVEHSGDLRKRIAELGPNKLISLVVVRMGQILTLTATLADRAVLEKRTWLDPSELPPPDDSTASDMFRIDTASTPVGNDTAAKPPSQGFLSAMLHQTPYTGATLEPMGAQLAAVFGAPMDSGLLVHSIDANSPAANCGLRAGDVVLRLNAVAVRTQTDWLKQVRVAKGSSIRVDVLRDRHVQALVMQPDLKRHSLLELPSFGWR